MDDNGGSNDETGDILTEKEDKIAPKTLKGSCTVTESATGNNESGDHVIDGSPKTETRPESDANIFNEQEEIKEP